jgi:hypothetical protein
MVEVGVRITASCSRRQRAADETQRAFGQLQADLAGAPVGVEHEPVEHDGRVGRQRQGRLVEEQKLPAPGGGALHAFVADHVGAERQRAGRRAGRRAAQRGFAGGDGADFLRGKRQGERGGQKGGRSGWNVGASQNSNPSCIDNTVSSAVVPRRAFRWVPRVST